MSQGIEGIRHFWQSLGISGNALTIKEFPELPRHLWEFQAFPEIPRQSREFLNFFQILNSGKLKHQQKITFIT